ncbi:MAG: chitobiase/beta-hexosaminidase C-terminal domain-containing protein, partial [Clostridia bacterium]|nr:chitobiase/beta-hexosaminidase C-terminal domain-containing protein [Clostridia bacterium]
YYVYFDLTNYPDDITRGRAVVSLKTAEGKLVDTTESAAFSIPKGGTKTGMEVFIPCFTAATRVELIIVNSYSSGVPISQVVTSSIDSGLAWSAWSEDEPTEGTYSQIESRQEYRYQDKETSTATTSEKDGWTLYDTTSTTSSGTTTSPVSAFSNESQTRTVTTRTETNYKNQTYYKYSHYYTASNSNGKPATSPVKYSGWTLHETGWRTSAFTANGTSSAGGTKYSGTACSKCGMKIWYNQTTKTESVANGTTTYYDYTDTFYTYHFYKWGAFSDWMDQYIASTADRNVEQRTVYRYKSEFADSGIEDNSGVTRTVEGTLGTSFAGKQLTLYVYKVDEASDFTNEYIGQTVTDENGAYSFTFKLREEPSVKTGDMTVAIGIEGSNNMMVIDTIEAPKPTYEVNFYIDGQKIGETQQVEKGRAAVLPENPEKEGYTFVGWDADTTNIQANADFTALFVKNKYTVVFVDFVAETVNVKEFYHGDVLTDPEITPVEGYIFAGWNEIDGEDAVVTENMVLTAKYEKQLYNVTFYDRNNNMLKTQVVEYGEAADEPNVPAVENSEFLGWESISDHKEVKEDLTVVASYFFNETCEDPVANVATGEYSSNQIVTLTCASDNAVIYYTTDGSDPRENDADSNAAIYSGPIVIDQSCILKFYATAMNMNDSEVVTKTYAINNGNTDSGLMTFEEIPEVILNNLDKYSLKNAVGYRYKDVVTTGSAYEAELLESSGWTLMSTDDGEWSEWSETQDAPADTFAVYETKDPDPVPTNFYQYSHWKYTDGGETVCSPAEVAGFDGEWESIEVANPLSIVAFVSGSPVYSYNGERWYSQTTVVKGVVPDYILYRYQLQTKSYYKWTDWTISAPAAGESRETETSTVFYYTIPTMHVVTVYPMQDDNAPFSVFAYDGDLISFAEDFYDTKGYDIVGYYLDEEKTTPIDLDTHHITTSIDVYPEYEAKTFNITFEYANGELISEQNIAYGENALVPRLIIPE